MTGKLLIIRLSALGDVAMLVPVVKALASQHSDLQITILSQKHLRPLFEDISDNVKFIGLDKKGEHKGIAGLNKLYRQLQAEGFNYIADCHDVLRTKYLRLRFHLANLCPFSSVRSKIAHIDKHRKGKRALTREQNKELVQQPTSFENYAETIEKLASGTLFCKDLLNSKTNVNTSPLRGGTRGAMASLAIGYAPFAAHAGKIYPLDKSFEVIKQLLARGCKIYLFGAGEKELKVFKEWQSKVNSQKSTVDSLTIASEVLAAEGKKGFKAELELMSTLDGMVTMDSGNMHLASIVGTRVVSVWGATHPLAGFLGWQQDIADCVQVDLPCRPCSIYGKKPCKHGDYPCLNNITPEQIVERVLGS